MLTRNLVSRRHLLLLHAEKTHDTKCNDRFCPQSHAITKSFWTPVNSERFRVTGILSSRIVNEKRMLFSYFSVNPCTPASCWRRSFKIIFGFFFLPTTILSNKGRHFVCLLLAKNYQMHSKAWNRKKVYGNRPIERASEQLPFPKSYLQLALAHARNSRVKKKLQFSKAMRIWAVKWNQTMGLHARPSEIIKIPWHGKYHVWVKRCPKSIV